MHDIIANCQLIARVAHHGQTRADNFTPYIVHPEGVAQRIIDERKLLGLTNAADFAVAVCAAWLHDVVEDCKINGKPVYFGTLYAFGVPADVVEIVDVLTKHDDGPAQKPYYDRIRTSPIALRVKYADRRYNLIDALNEVKAGRNVERWKRYAAKTRRDVLPMYEASVGFDSLIAAYMRGALEMGVELIESA